MEGLSFKTLFINNTFVDQHVKCYILDVTGLILGRVISRIIHIITGKNKPYYSPNINCGDKIIIINANKIKVTGNKLSNKKYVRYTGYPGGKKYVLLKDQLNLSSIKVIEHAIKGMLPKNRLRKSFMKNLYIFNSDKHNFCKKNIEILSL